MTVGEIALALMPLVSVVLILAGTVLVACSFGANPGRANQVVDGRVIYLASFLQPTWFKLGLLLIVAGSLLQVVLELLRLLKIA